MGKIRDLFSFRTDQRLDPHADHRNQSGPLYHDYMARWKPPPQGVFVIAGLAIGATMLLARRLHVAWKRRTRESS